MDIRKKWYGLAVLMVAAGLVSRVCSYERFRRGREAEHGLMQRRAGTGVGLHVIRLQPFLFRQQFLERPSLWRTSPLTAPGGDELFNIKKRGSPEPDAWIRLYRLES